MIDIKFIRNKEVQVMIRGVVVLLYRTRHGQNYSKWQRVAAIVQEQLVKWGKKNFSFKMVHAKVAVGPDTGEYTHTLRISHSLYQTVLYPAVALNNQINSILSGTEFTLQDELNFSNYLSGMLDFAVQNESSYLHVGESVMMTRVVKRQHDSSKTALKAALESKIYER